MPETLDHFKSGLAGVHVHVAVYRTVFNVFKQHIFNRHMFAPRLDIVHTTSTDMLQSGTYTLLEDKEETQVKLIIMKGSQLSQYHTNI